MAFANQYGVCFFFKTDSNNKYIAGISNRFVVYKQCVLHLPAAWHAAKELRSADHSHLMVGQSSNNRIHTHVNKNYFAIDAPLVRLVLNRPFVDICRECSSSRTSSGTIFRSGAGILLKCQFRDSLLMKCPIAMHRDIPGSAAPGFST